MSILQIFHQFWPWKVITICDEEGRPRPTTVVVVVPGWFYQLCLFLSPKQSSRVGLFRGRSGHSPWSTHLPKNTRPTTPLGSARTSMSLHTAICWFRRGYSGLHASHFWEKVTPIAGVVSRLKQAFYVWNYGPFPVDSVSFFRPKKRSACFFFILFEPANQHNWDQLFGIISRRIANESSLQDPDDVAEAIQSELTKPTVKDWVGIQTRVEVKKMNATHSWRTHLPATGVKLEGGLLRDDEGNHMFLCMQRRGKDSLPSYSPHDFPFELGQKRMNKFQLVYSSYPVKPISQLLHSFWPSSDRTG